MLTIEATRLNLYVMIGWPRVGCFVYRWCYAAAQGNLRSSRTRTRRRKCFIFSDPGSVAERLVCLGLRHPSCLRTTGFRFRSRNTSPRLTCAWVVGLQKNSVGGIHRNVFCRITLFSLLFHAVYGPQNVTSGASSDLRHATSTASAMVKVKNSSIYLV